MASSGNTSCFGECNISICPGTQSEYRQWRQSYLSPEVRINFALTATLSALSCPVTAILNGLAIYTILSNPLLSGVPSNLAIAMLCVTDFLVGIISQPLFIFISICRMLGHCSECIVDSTFYLSLRLFLRASIYHLVIVSTDRLVAVKIPYRYYKLVTSRKIVYFSKMIWTYSFIMAIIAFFKNKNIAMEIIVTTCRALDGVAVFVIVVCYVVMYFEAKKHHNTIQATITAVSPAQSYFKETLKAAKTTFLVTCSVLVIYILNDLVSAYIYRTFPAEKSLFNANVYFSVRSWNILILMLNSLFNPFIYILRSEKLSREIKKKCMRVLNHINFK